MRGMIDSSTPSVGMTDAELQAILRAAEQNLREVVAGAAVLQDWPARQLSVLRNTYPAWEIDRAEDASGLMWWTAELRQTFTFEIAAAGVMKSVRQPDAIALASTLAWQSALLHNAPSA